MNHKWKKIPLDEDEKGKWPTTKKYKCVVCGCIKRNQLGFDIYSRSGHVFNYRPDCINEEIENSKTID